MEKFHANQNEGHSLRNIQTSVFIPVNLYGVRGENFYRYHPFCAIGTVNNYQDILGSAYGAIQ